MRKLSDSFITALQSGFLTGITDLARRDSDIDLQIRENYLTVSKEVDQFQFILILIDYNPNSQLFQPADLQALPFAGQIKIFQTGFGMWQKNVRPLA